MSSISRFPSKNTALPSTVMVRRERPAMPSIVKRSVCNAQLCSTRALDDGNLHTFATHTILESGEYLVTATITVRKIATVDESTVLVDFLQLFVGDVADPFAYSSVQVNADMYSQHTITATTSAMVHLVEGQIDGHVNFSSDDNSMFEYVADLSAMNFFRLD